MIKKLSILAVIAGLSFLPSIANAQERLGDGAMGALAAPWSAARSAWLRAASLATRPGRRLVELGSQAPALSPRHYRHHPPATRLRKR